MLKFEGGVGDDDGRGRRNEDGGLPEMAKQ